MNLDLIERRGKLIYAIGIDVRSIEGHFRLSLDGKVIEARKLRGRNRWRLCSRENALQFIERRDEK
jgi:hypothetical protein